MNPSFSVLYFYTYISFLQNNSHLIKREIFREIDWNPQKWFWWKLFYYYSILIFIIFFSKCYFFLERYKEYSLQTSYEKYRSKFTKLLYVFPVFPYIFQDIELISAFAFSRHLFHANLTFTNEHSPLGERKYNVDQYVMPNMRFFFSEFFFSSFVWPTK